MAPYNLRDAASRREAITLQRLERLLPELMDETGVDCWIITSREYADDSVAMTMLPTDWFSTRRRSILVFLRSDEGLKRLSVARYDLGDFFETAWDPGSQPNQWQALTDLLDTHQPRTIAVNVSDDFAHGDGLTHGEHQRMVEALGSDHATRVIPADPLSILWLQTRLPQERLVMETACREAHSILRRALSPEAITARVTTTDDVVWWLRDRVQELGVPVWFQPTVSVQRRTGDLRGSFAVRPGPETIEAGDLAHIDFGIVWDGLCTDQQQHGYILAPGENAPPEWLEAALSKGNRMQDILTGHFITRRTGNEVLRRSLEQARDEGVDGVVYTHPIGFHGHGAGPTIGLWDNQEGVAGAGDRPLRANTAWSIELMVKVQVPEWDNRIVSIMLEEDAWFDGESVEFLDGRQTDIWVI